MSIFDSLSEYIPCLADFYLKLKALFAWKGIDMLSERDVSRRFVVAEQCKDALCVEALKLLSSRDPSDKVVVSQRDITPALRGFMPGLLDQDGILYKMYESDADDRLKLVLPSSNSSPLCKQVAWYFHCCSGHVNLEDTIRRLRRHFWWPRLRRDTKSVYNGCLHCQLTKRGSLPKTVSPHLCPTEIFSTVGVDLFGPLNESKSGFRWILICVDLLSRYTVLIPLAAVTAAVVSAAIERNIILVFRTPECIISDQGVQFVRSVLLDGLCLSYKIRHLSLPLRHPASGSFYERQNRTLGATLRSLLSEHKGLDWYDVLALGQLRINTTVHPDLGVSPHEVVFGIPHSLPLVSFLSPSDSLSERDIEDFVCFQNRYRREAVLEVCEALRKKRGRVLRAWIDEWSRARAKYEKWDAKTTATAPSSPSLLEVGSKVLVLKPPTHKLDGKWVPGIVRRHVGRVCYEVDVEGSTISQVYHKDHVKLFIPPDPDLVPTKDVSYASHMDDEVFPAKRHFRGDSSVGSPKPKRSKTVVEPLTSRGLHPFDMHTLVGWRVENAIPRLGIVLGRDINNQVVIHEHHISEDSAVPLWLDDDGVVRQGGIPTTSPVIISMEPKQLVRLTTVDGLTLTPRAKKKLAEMGLPSGEG
ncbi:hypothetical protein FOZ62_019436 [Perkinsus olseni]|uniref:Integrase catalytic domain-containing protein n=1 Tax=Perkinsus olseni TaxID=32597 RepID=A0A7J6U0A4_PEROL|nr:hypothetical protein FOZ62_019436 [Perkinsus olseni]